MRSQVPGEALEMLRRSTTRDGERLFSARAIDPTAPGLGGKGERAVVARASGTL